MSSWKEIASRKRAGLATSIPPEWRIPEALLPPETQDSVMEWPDSSGWFTQEELDITNSTASQLVPRLASGELKSETVVRAFCKRACAAHQLTNCLSETCFDRAIATAKARDAHLAKTGTPLGPLHGLPISLKDNFNLKGLDTTLGIASHAENPAQDDSALAKLLEDAGAVFYVKTNTPTAMMIAQTVNNVFGRTTNPRNRRTTPGGSSGGEAALIVFKGSPLGVGSDIGGSLRIPAGCTGVFTLRPSFGRFPTRYCRSGMPGQEAVNSVNGPMARTLEDILFYSKAVVGRQPWRYDAKCVPIPWRPFAASPEKLRIGVMWSDGLVQPTPPVTRALSETVAKLQATGVAEIIDWEPVNMAQSADLITRMFNADGGAAIRNALGRTGEPRPPGLTVSERGKELNTSELWELLYERSDFQNKDLDRWNETRIDALLLPTNPHVTVKHDAIAHIPYTSTFNILDYSSICFPTGTTVDKAVDQPLESYKPLSPKCEKINNDYDVDLIHGLPISLQLVTRRFEEEKAIALTEQVLRTLS